MWKIFTCSEIVKKNFIWSVLLCIRMKKFSNHIFCGFFFCTKCNFRGSRILQRECEWCDYNCKVASPKMVWNNFLGKKWSGLVRLTTRSLCLRQLEENLNDVRSFWTNDLMRKKLRAFFFKCGKSTQNILCFFRFNAMETENFCDRKRNHC